MQLAFPMVQNLLESILRRVFAPATDQHREGLARQEQIAQQILANLACRTCQKQKVSHNASALNQIREVPVGTLETKGRYSSIRMIPRGLTS